MKVPGKISFRPFWPFSGQKYIACGNKNGVFGGFWQISSNLLMLYGQVLLYEQYLLFIYEKNEFRILTSKIFTRFGHFFGKKWSFLAINQRFGQFLKIYS